MASLREVARDLLYDAQDAISWLVIWKEGRSWYGEKLNNEPLEVREYFCGNNENMEPAFEFDGYIWCLSDFTDNQMIYDGDIYVIDFEDEKHINLYRG